MRVRFPWWGGFVVVALVLAAGARDAAAQLAVDRSGRAFEVRPDGSSVRVRSAPPGGQFGAWRTVVRAARDERVMDAGIAADGTGIVVIERERGVRMVTFGARAVGSSRRGDADFAASAVAPTGAAVVVWFRHRGDRRWRLEASIRDAGARAFGRPQPLSRFVRRACCTSVDAAIGARGDAVVTWSSTARPAVWAAQRRAGRGFRRAQRLTTNAATVPKAVVGADGTAAVSYSTQHVPLRPSDGLQLHTASSTRRFGAAAHVNPGGGVTVADVAIAPNGDTTVAWLDKVAGARVHVSEARAGSPLSLTAQLGTDVSSRSLAVDTDAAGRTVIAWSERTGGGERVTAAITPATGAPFGPPTALGGSWRAAEPQLARLVPTGGALVLWMGARYAGPTARRTALAVTRLP